jgi:hypothetical protein
MKMKIVNADELDPSKGLRAQDYIKRNEYRCTRPDLYTNETRMSPELRQGHYIQANSTEEALTIMQKKFPKENIDVQFWREIT